MFAPFIQYLLQSGVSEYALIVLLFLPMVTALITFARYVIGIRTINIYTTVLLAYALLDLGYTPKGNIDYAATIIYGGLIMFAISSIGLWIHQILYASRLHYLAKVSIVSSFAVMGVFTLLYGATLVNQVDLNMINPITILLFIVALESLVKSSVRHGIKKAVYLMTHTIVLAIGIFFIMSQEIMQNAVFDYPEISLLMIVLSFIAGKWRGLKLLEFIRFRNILKQDVHDSEDFGE
ncbi:MAG: hypothetical protein UZ22_OP11002000419 [Microgenomates bacterium OLB23]|nr:MAG: hypothetical protein UZ22_OP11002000419 [Microgenomates bacterium OLB23]